MAMELTLVHLQKYNKAVEKNIDIYNIAMKYPYCWNTVCEKATVACTIAFTVMERYISHIREMKDLKGNLSTSTSLALQSNTEGEKFLRSKINEEKKSTNFSNDFGDELFLLSSTFKATVKLSIDGRDLIFNSPISTSRFPYPICALKLETNKYLPVFPSSFVYIINKVLQDDVQMPGDLSFYKFGAVYKDVLTDALHKKYQYCQNASKYYMQVVINDIKNMMIAAEKNIQKEQIIPDNQKNPLINNLKFSNLYNNYLQLFNTRYLLSPLFTSILKQKSLIFTFGKCKNCKTSTFLYVNSSPKCLSNKKSFCYSCCVKNSKRAESSFFCICGVNKHMLNADQTALLSIFNHWLFVNLVQFNDAKTTQDPGKLISLYCTNAYKKDEGKQEIVKPYTPAPVSSEVHIHDPINTTAPLCNRNIIPTSNQPQTQIMQNTNPSAIIQAITRLTKA